MSSLIQKSDFLALTKEQGFPKELDLENIKSNTQKITSLVGKVHIFEGVNEILYFGAGPTKIPLAKKENDNYTFWGQVEILELHHDYKTQTTSGKFKITMIYPPERIKKPEQGKGILTSGVVIISGNKLLLVKHKDNAEHETGVYGIPAGRPAQNEDITDAAIREILEETGLHVYREDLYRLNSIPFAEILRKSGETRTFVLIPFLTTKFKGDIILNNESMETIPQWVELSELDKLKFLPNIKDVVLEAVEKVKTQPGV